MNPEKFQAYAEKIINNCGRVIVGKDEVIRQVIVSFLCGGHVSAAQVLPQREPLFRFPGNRNSPGGGECRPQRFPAQQPG